MSTNNVILAYRILAIVSLVGGVGLGLLALLASCTYQSGYGLVWFEFGRGHRDCAHCRRRNRGHCVLGARGGLA
jgi:hypothetical protein